MQVANQQPRLPRATSSLALNACRDGASTASLGSLCSVAVTFLLVLCEHRKFQINSAADQMKGLVHSHIYLHSPHGKSQPIAAVLGGLMIFKVLHSHAGWHFMGSFAGRMYFFWGKKIIKNKLFLK